jgi:hypothetical protein
MNATIAQELAEGIEALEELREAAADIYASKTRRAPLGDRYRRVLNDSQYALLAAREALQHGDHPAEARRLLRRSHFRVGELLDALLGNPVRQRRRSSAA